MMADENLKFLLYSYGHRRKRKKTMTIELLKQMMDACYLAKRTRDLLPPLPKGVASSYIQYLDVMEQMEQRGMQVKVSDISDALGLPRPGVTRTIKEMETKGYLTKTVSAEDGRITYLHMTKEGRELSQIYNTEVFENLCRRMEDITQEDAQCMIRTITRMYQIMSEWRA